eukprot:gene3269-1599_t
MGTLTMNCILLATGSLVIVLNCFEAVCLLRVTKRKPFDSLLLSLSFADILSATPTVIFVALRIVGMLKDQDGLLLLIILMASTGFSHDHTAAITIERLLAVKQPLAHSIRMRGKFQGILITVVWVLGILNAIMIIWVYKNRNYTLLFLKVGCGSVIPHSIFYTVSYISIFRAANAREAFIHTEREGAQRSQIKAIWDESAHKKQRNMFITSVMLVFSFVVCLYPTCIDVLLAKSINDLSDKAHIFLLVNSICNPLIYFYKGYRQRLINANNRMKLCRNCFISEGN